MSSIFILSAEIASKASVVNRERTRQLASRLQRAGLPALEVWGRYGGHDEASFLTWGLDQAAVLDLAGEFGQESILEIDPRTNLTSLIYLGSGRESVVLGPWREVTWDDQDDNFSIIGNQKWKAGV